MLPCRQGPPHLRLETISGRNGPCPVPRKPSPESSVPGKNLPRGSRRNQLRRGHGSPPVLSEVFSSLAFRCALQRVQTVPAAIHSGRIPPPRQPIHGDGRLRQPPHHTGHGPFRALIVSNLKWGGPCRGHYVFPAGRYQIFHNFKKSALKAYRISRARNH